MSPEDSPKDISDAVTELNMISGAKIDGLTADVMSIVFEAKMCLQDSNKESDDKKGYVERVESYLSRIEGSYREVCKRWSGSDYGYLLVIGGIIPKLRARAEAFFENPTKPNYRAIERTIPEVREVAENYTNRRERVISVIWDLERGGTSNQI